MVFEMSHGRLISGGLQQFSKHSGHVLVILEFPKMLIVRCFKNIKTFQCHIFKIFLKRSVLS